MGLIMNFGPPFLYGNEKYSDYMIPRSRSLSCHFQAEANVSASVSVAFQPKTLLARSGLAQTYSMSPSRRPTILCGTLTPVAASNVLISSNTETPLPVPRLKISTLSRDLPPNMRSMAIT